MTAETPTHDVAVSALDPVTLEVLWNRLLSVANEQQAALMRTAFSTVVREAQDCSSALFDPDLFIERIDLFETEDYLRRVYLNYGFYDLLYR